MEKNEDICNEKDAKSKLVDLKLPLVLRDYQSYFEADARDINILMTLRGWEISLISALVVFLFTKDSIARIPNSPLYIILIVLMFWLHESITLAYKYQRKKNVVEKEQKLQETNLGAFRKNIILWKFGDSKANKWNLCEVIKYTFMFLIKRSTIVWHGPLAIIITFMWHKPLAIIMMLLLFILICLNLNNENTS